MFTTNPLQCHQHQTQVASLNGFSITRTCARAAEFLQNLRHTLAGSLARQFAELPGTRIEQALAEAEALAYQTPFPHLLLPELAEEKVRAAAKWTKLQSTLRPPRHLPSASLSV